MTPLEAARLAAWIAEHPDNCYCPTCAEYGAVLISGGYDKTGAAVTDASARPAPVE